MSSQDSCSSKVHIWEVAARRFDLSCRPHVMGVLNVTPDSFSDGAEYFDIDCAVDRALAMEDEGADSIDIGGESTRPYASPVAADEELRRVIPVVERLSKRLGVPISIDTYKAAVAKEALRAGAEIVNDISGCTFDPDMAEVVASASAGLVIMHIRGKPADMQFDTDYHALVPEIVDFLRNRIAHVKASGVAEERIVVDPGIGFGKSLQGNLEILNRLGEFSVLARPVLVGVSRKGFVGAITGRAVDERIFGTAAAVALSIANGASLVRVHDVAQMRDAALVAHAIASFSCD